MTAAELFNSKELSDIQFIVGPEGHVVYAHRLLLATSGSEYFSTLVKAAEQNEKILLPNTKVEYFLPLLEFLYTKQLKADPEHLLGVLKLAVQYLLPEPRDEAISLLQGYLPPSNVLSVFKEVRIYMTAARWLMFSRRVGLPNNNRTLVAGRICASESCSPSHAVLTCSLVTGLRWMHSIRR